MRKSYVNYFKVVFNRSCFHGNYESVKFYLSIKIFHQYIQFYFPSFSFWAATFLVPCLGKWHIPGAHNSCIYSQTAKTVFSHLNCHLFVADGLGSNRVSKWFLAEFPRHCSKKFYLDLKKITDTYIIFIFQSAEIKRFLEIRRSFHIASGSAIWHTGSVKSAY